MAGDEHLPRLYTELAEWWPVLSIPEDYAEEAEFYRKAIISASTFPVQTMLELGCGGGNNASHLKKHFRLTLTDLAPGMLDVSRRLNPECEHQLGDMRNIRLGHQFDVVFAHDAVTYITIEGDLRQVMETAFVHCRPGGVALFAPDFVRETFYSITSHGGHDRADRGLRYLRWVWDPNPDDTTYFCEMVYLLEDGNKPMRCIHDRHINGLFSKKVWLTLMAEAGFLAQAIPFEHSEVRPNSTFVFIGVKPK